MNAPIHPIEQLHVALPDLDWVTESPRIARLSQDFSWFSPVLKRQLAGKVADAVVRPRNEEELRRLVALCAKLRIPITVRGSGTGNYGQAVPLQGGVVLDMSGYNQFLWARDGAARAQAGIRLWDLEKQARAACGMELRCMPSTFRSATLGGLFGGGFGGIGSINHGPLAARGNVLGIKAITIEEDPQVIELRGAEALLMHHLWGTNGLVLEVELALAPALDWQEQLVVFDDFDAALDFGQAVASCPGIAKREVGFLAAPIPDAMKPLAEYLPVGCHAIILAIAPSSEAAVLELAALHGGRVTYRKDAGEIARTHRTLLEYTWNHTTLMALKVDKGITYLQSAFTPGRHLEQVRRMEQLLAGEVQMHAEFIRNLEGQVTCTALQLVKFSTEERLQEIMAIHRANGVRINDPHVYIVEDGKAGGELPQAILDVKKRFDPHGLLNPGKVRAWMGKAAPMTMGQPMANYAAARRVGDFLFVSGVVAVDPQRKAVVQSYEDLPPHAREQLRSIGYDTGQMTVDLYEAPAVAQSWFVLERIRQIAHEHGAQMGDAIKLVQYFRDLRHYPFYNRVRGLFYGATPPASTVVEVARFMPSDAAWIEVEATIHLK